MKPKIRVVKPNLPIPNIDGLGVVVKPNLHILNIDGLVGAVTSQIYFTLDYTDIIRVSEKIDSVLLTQREILKVKDLDLELATYGKVERNAYERDVHGRYTIPLQIYLREVARRGCLEKTVQSLGPDGFYGKGFFGGVLPESEVFIGLGHIIDAKNVENPSLLKRWEAIERNSANLASFFENFRRVHRYAVVDRERTLEEMQRFHQELDIQLPEVYVALFVGLLGHYIEPHFKIREGHRKNLGILSLIPFKTEGTAKLDEVKSKLVELLKDVDGPELLVEPRLIANQITDLYR